jgi:hypothetical protein
MSHSKDIGQLTLKSLKINNLADITIEKLPTTDRKEKTLCANQKAIVEKLFLMINPYPSGRESLKSDFLQNHLTMAQTCDV